MDPDGPVVGWVSPDEPDGLGVRETAREAWRLTRANLGPLLAITAIPVILLNILYLPFWIEYGRLIDSMIQFWTTLDFSRYRYDPEALQRDMQAAMQPSTELALLSALCIGIAIVVVAVGVGAITSGTLTASDGGRPSFAGAYRAVAAHPRALIVPALLLGIGYAVVITPLTLNQGSFMTGGASAGQVALSSLLSIGSLVLSFLILYLFVRWAVFFQVVLAEGLGFRAALARSAALTSGARVKIGLAIIVLSIAIGFIGALACLVIALIVGLLTMSITGGILGYTLSLGVCTLIYFPFFVALLTVIYRRRVADVPPVAAVAATGAPAGG